MDLTPKDLLNLESEVGAMLKKYGKNLLEVWQTIKQVSLKDYREPVTEFDIKTEKQVRAELSEILPEAGFIVEEGENEQKGEFNWIIDPIDQTKNFIGQIPLFYIQVALTYKDESVLGVIYNPVSDQMFTASVGNGTKVNGALMASKTKATLKESLVDFDFGGSDNNSLLWKIPVIKKFAESAYRIRMTGGAFLPYMATGGIDVYIDLDEKTKMTDKMPRIILVRELGLLFEEFQLENNKIYIVGNKNVVEEIKQILAS